eukprot:TRINITY_DN19613_c0_g1_i1.p1 TRINITY_DN19613_c0_g1~~TRINITY_DN19613_c0_g1_i1.p1  ORF type:complete len:614 (+),score=134.20 TRINITY_DN19613_c0_g1_i1:116-1957(+)
MENSICRLSIRGGSPPSWVTVFAAVLGAQLLPAQCSPTGAPSASPTKAPSDTLQNAVHSVECTPGTTCWCPLIPQDFFINPENVTSLLVGHTLQVGVHHYPPFTSVDHSAPAGSAARFSGFEVELMRSLAEIGGFQVEFHEFPFPADSWTMTLLSEADKYDLVAGGWSDTSSRRRRGIVFTSHHADFGAVLLVPKPHKVDPGFWTNAWFWLQPFTWDAYPAIVLCFIVPSTGIWFLEKARQPGVSGFCEALYMGWLGLLGFGDHTWVKNWFSRATNFYWSLLVLVLIASYTASLTNFLVQSSQAQLVASDLDDFLQRGLRACTPSGWATEQLVTARYHKQANQFVSVTDTELSMRVAEGRCDGMVLPLDNARVLLSGGPPRTAPKNGDTEYGCGLQIVGRTVMPGLGAFPADLANCRWFVAQVVSGLLRALTEQHEVEEMFVDAVKQVTSLDNGYPVCPSASDDASGDSDTVRISFHHLAGLFMVAFLPAAVIPIAGFIVNWQCKRRGKPDWAVDNRTLDDESIELLTTIRQEQQSLMAEIHSFAPGLRKALAGGANLGRVSCISSAALGARGPPVTEESTATMMPTSPYGNSEDAAEDLLGVARGVPDTGPA